jgi:RNA polymerase sigma-70 factor (ECF subfamily)
VPEYSSDEDNVPRQEASFNTTHWSVVLTAREQDESVAREALGKLCSTYWYPIYAMVRRQGFPPHEAEDLTQEFFYRFLARDSLRSVTPEAGKFRSFLLGCLKHFLINERERAQTQRRGGGCPTLPLEGATAETRYLLEPADNVTPEVLFDRRWALTVLDQALQQLGEDYAARQQGDLFESLKAFLPGSQVKVSRTEAAARHNLSVSALDVAIHRLRQRFCALLRAQVAETVASPDQVEEELRYLVSMLGA